MDFRAQFPQLSETVYGKPLVYLDNAATSLRPLCVARKWEESALHCNSNLHRAVHFFAGRATKEYENARKFVAGFLGADPGEIVFTSGATMGLNLVASSYGELAVGEGDNIIIGEAEHHSDIVPFQMLCKRKGASVRVLPVDESGRLRCDVLESLIDSRTRLVCVAHISNVLGLVNPIRRIADVCRSRAVPLLVDGAQGIVHEKVDVRALGCDFYAFSGHKVYAAPGTGALYIRRELLDRMPPYMGGGEMIGSVSWEETTFAEGPQKFEAGTQNISGVPTLVPALSLSEEMGLGELPAITEFLLDELPRIKGLRLYGLPDAENPKAPLFSLSINGVHHEDAALVLDKMGFAVRSGQMCAEPLMRRFGVSGMLRASFAPYNTLEEARAFVQALRKACLMLA